MRFQSRLVALAAVCSCALLPWSATALAGQRDASVVPGSPDTATAPELGDRGALEGRVVDARSGQPVEGADVEVASADHVVVVKTGADGRFEAGRLKPAAYSILVTVRGYVPVYYGTAGGGGTVDSVQVRAGDRVRGLDVRLHAESVVAGHISGPDGAPLADVEIEILAQPFVRGSTRRRPVAFGKTDAAGAYRATGADAGSYYIRAYLPSGELPAHAGEPAVVLSPTFYPGVPSAEEAQPILLGPGEELLAVDFAMVTGRTFRVAGTVVDPERPSMRDLKVGLRSFGPDGQTRAYVAPVDAEGRFELSGVPAGTYMLHVDEPVPGPGTTKWLAAMRRAEVGADIEGVELRAGVMVDIAGRVVVDSGETRLPDLSTVALSLSARSRGIDGAVQSDASFSWSVPVGADGSFQLTGPAGTVSLSAASLPQGWTVRSARLGVVDIDPDAFELDGGIKELEVVLTQTMSGLTGQVSDREGRPLPEQLVLVFPEDAASWVPSSRRIRDARTDRDGRFSIADLPPGNYLVIAVASLPAAATRDLAVLEHLKGDASGVRIGFGERATVSLRALPLRDGLGP